jgi:hypothetical protein
MKNLFILIGKFFLYLLYVGITWNERNRYTLGSIRGHNITEYKPTLTGADIRYQPDVKPVREYLTWKQYWKLHNPYKKQSDGIKN